MVKNQRNNLVFILLITLFGKPPKIKLIFVNQILLKTDLSSFIINHSESLINISDKLEFPQIGIISIRFHAEVICAFFTTIRVRGTHSKVKGFSIVFNYKSVFIATKFCFEIYTFSVKSCVEYTIWFLIIVSWL